MMVMKSSMLGQLPKFIKPPQMDGENKTPVIQTALDAVRQLRSDGGGCLFSTMLFLSICNSALTILDRIGPTMRVLRQDLRQNTERLQMMYKSNPSSFSCLTEIVKREAEEGTARKPLSCTRAILWLTRSMDFTMIFVAKLMADADQDLIHIIEESYSATLQPWHGWISSAAYKVALKLIPERKFLINLIMEEREDYGAVKEEINSLVSSFTPILNEIHAFLATLRLDRLKSS